MLVLTDLLEESAARSLVAAVPVLARRHAVVVASAADPDLETIVRTEPRDPLDVYTAAAALDVLGRARPRGRAATPRRRAGDRGPARGAERRLRPRLPQGEVPRPALTRSGRPRQITSVQ